MIPEDQAAPRQRGRTRATIEDLLLDAAASTALEATAVRDLDEARVILSMTDQLLGGPVLAEDHNVTVLAARPKAASSEDGPSGRVIQLGWNHTSADPGNTASGDLP
ncbi:hypothetical protein E1161_04750 [Saccharopolyspora aridisoli]|uniref:Uncharacterized protein n=1 Tax=Saccharopolyspora aridisoli TaxID=2530385 RepID=A0A4R4UTT9_9PSEU|nr:hypothetical protein [Saccharopolyspora aridisoli]TDC95491.1 hypothetical protein E1161_04750 [Saccharopolyspora aridisoli]